MKVSGKKINDNLDKHKSQFETDADTYKEMFEDEALRINCNKNPAVRSMFWQKLWLFSKNFTLDYVQHDFDKGIDYFKDDIKIDILNYDNEIDHEKDCMSSVR